MDLNQNLQPTFSCVVKTVQDVEVHDLDQTLLNYDDDHLIHPLLYSPEKFNCNPFITRKIVFLYMMMIIIIIIVFAIMLFHRDVDF